MICIVAVAVTSILTRHVVQLIGPPTAILELLGKGRQERGTSGDHDIGQTHVR